MKIEGSGSKGTQVIERKRSVTDGQTARRTDGQTDKEKTICLIIFVKKYILYYTIGYVLSHAKSSHFISNSKQCFILI